jgi:TolB-like protein/DNA-binding winged helix-turn-helix (wHTH) protein/Tfp pilus assembly protein PilF
MTKTDAPSQIGSAQFDPITGELSLDGKCQKLRPQTAQVLAVLIENSGTLVSKSDLLDWVWPDTHVTEDSLVQCVSEIRKILRDVGGAEIKTIAKKGYRLDLSPQDEAPSEPESRPRHRWGWAIGLVIVALTLTSIFLTTRPANDAQQTTIAVMPFQNMSGDPAQVYFSNGLAADLITDLSGLSDIRVISRGASFSLNSSVTSVQELAQVLRADVIVEGSVRRMDESLRISVALVDGETGANLWAKRYEGTTEDIFSFQDEVADALLRTLSVRLSSDERRRLGVRGTNNIEAHDAYLRGRELENLYTAETNLRAEDALQQAIRIDPNYALPHAHLAQVYSFRVENNWTSDRDGDIRAAFEHAERSVALDPDLPFAHFSLGRLYTRSFAPDEVRAIEAYEAALRLDPNYDDAYVFLANIHIFNGRANEALPLIAEAKARNPIPPYWYALAEGMARYFLGDYEAAEAHLVHARDQNPTAPYPYRFLIATYGQMGNIDEADWMAMEYETLGRKATIEALLSSASIQDPAYRSSFAEGFRLANLPEK